MEAVGDLDAVLDRYHLALDEFMRGNSQPAKDIFSKREDVTLGNPFGPFARGWRTVSETMDRAASHYQDGEASGFENVATCITPALAYIVEVERLRSKVAGRKEVVPLALRVTSVFRPEDGEWKLVHRHADPITSDRPAESVIQT